MTDTYGNVGHEVVTPGYVENSECLCDKSQNVETCISLGYFWFDLDVSAALLVLICGFLCLVSVIQVLAFDLVVLGKHVSFDCNLQKFPNSTINLIVPQIYSIKIIKLGN